MPQSLHCAPRVPFDTSTALTRRLLLAVRVRRSGAADSWLLPTCLLLGRRGVGRTLKFGVKIRSSGSVVGTSGWSVTKRPSLRVARR